MSRAESERRRKRRRERKWHKALKRWRNQESEAPLQREGRGLRLLSYTITEERLEIPHNDYAGLHLSDNQRVELFDQVHDNPQAAIPRLRTLLEQCPDSAVLHNWLSTAYHSMGDEKEAEKIAQANYERHPDYLFARLNLAQFALARGEVERFRQIFDGEFDLKMIYPDRDVFHISEFVGFASLMIEYYVRVDELRAAETMFSVLEQIAPNAPATQSARETLQHWSLLRLLEKAKDRLCRPRAKRRPPLTSEAAKDSPPTASPSDKLTASPPTRNHHL
jgi:tetratricopeptide (TPR) repeat protein